MKNFRAILVFHQDPSQESLRKRLMTGGSWQRAARLLADNLRHTLNVASRVRGADVLLCYDNVPPADHAGADRLLPQVGHRFGDRIRHCVDRAHALGYREYVIIGTDSPEISGAVLRSAFQSLSAADFAVGPSRDGGFFLLGFGAAHVGRLPLLLASLPWFTRQVCGQLLRKIRSLGASHALLAPLRDVDSWADVRSLGAAWTTLPDRPDTHFSGLRWADPASVSSLFRRHLLRHLQITAPPLAA